MVPCPVNVAWDVTAGTGPHNLWIPTPPTNPYVVPSPVPAIEMIATQMWTAGYFTGKNQLTTDIVHRMPIVLDGHDLGPLIPDVTIPFTNYWYAIMWPFSSRKTMFAASTVKMNGKPTAVADGVLPFFMISCGEPISCPLTWPLSNRINTVIVGVSLGDIILGIVNIGVSMAIDFAFSKIDKGSGKGISGDEFVGGLLDKAGVSPREFAKKAVQAGSGWVIGAVDSHIRGDGSLPPFKLTVGSAFGERGVQIGGEDQGLVAPWDNYTDPLNLLGLE
jgi:hypothetical protein